MNPALTFGILGPIEARRGDDHIPLGRPKQRAVLAVLLLHVDQVVSIDRLLALLWDEPASSPPLGALHTYVSNLRRALEPDRSPRGTARVLLSQAGGYRLAVDPAAVDAVRFETDARLGLRLLVEERPAEAREILSGALALWRGPALADFSFSEFAQPEAGRLENLRLLAVEARLEADLALGAHAAAVPALEQLVGQHPLREGLWAALMVALYRNGQQADALRAFQRCRAALNADLGLEPGPELRRLEAWILAQDPSLEWAPPRGPTHPRTERAEDQAPSAPPGHGALVGRDRELGRLRTAWAQACDRTGGFILVTGEAGIGKTRLVEELAGIATADGARVVWGRCCETEEAPPFWLWSQVLTDLLADLSAETVTSALEALGLGRADLAPLAALPVDGGGTEVVGGGSSDARFRLYRAVAAVLRAAAAEQPVALLLDDLHWADGPSLGLLRFLASELANGPLVVVLAYREAEGRARQPLLEALAAVARLRVIERVDLCGLDAADVKPFIEAVTGVEVGPELVGAIHRRTEGNPFFISELIRLLESEGGLADDDAAQGSSVPVGVRDVTRRRLSHASEPTQRLLELAAVIGQEFDLDVLSAASAQDEGTTLDHLEPALVQGMVLEVSGRPGRYRFSHALVRDALYEDLSAVRRARLHAGAAEALELCRGCHPAAVELARHYFLAAQVVRPEKCIPYLLEAAGVAMESLAHEHAELHLRRALGLLGMMPASDRRDHIELWVQTRLGLVLGTTAGPAAPEVAEVFARAHDLCASSGKEATELPMIYGPFLFAWAAGDRAGAHQHANQLLDLAARSHDPRYLLAGHLAKGMVLFDQGEPAAAAGRFEHVTILADSLADPSLASVLHADPRVSGRIMRAQAVALADPHDQSEALAGEGVALARRIEHPYSEAVALASAAFVAVVCDRPGTARRAAEAAIDHSTAHAFPVMASAAVGLRGWAIARQGDTSTGLSVLRDHVAATMISGISRVRHFHLALLAEVELWAGLLDDALATAAQGLHEATIIGSCFYAAELHRIRGAALLAATPALVDQAEASYIEARALARRQGALRLAERADAGIQACHRHERPALRASR